jgi:hypothetical protein
MKYLILATAALGLAACEADVHTPAGGGSTTVIAPGEKSVEKNTTVVQPDAGTSTSTSTTTTKQ